MIGKFQVLYAGQIEGRGHQTQDVVGTDKSWKVITLFPTEELFVANAY